MPGIFNVMDSDSVPSTGGTFSGPVYGAGNPTHDFEFAIKRYVDEHVKKSGDTMTGQLKVYGAASGEANILVGRVHGNPNIEASAEAASSWLILDGYRPDDGNVSINHYSGGNVRIGQGGGRTEIKGTLRLDGGRLRIPNPNTTAIRLQVDGGDVAFDTRIDESNKRVIFPRFGGSGYSNWDLRLGRNDNMAVVVPGDFTVNGSKNAELIDPDDPTKGYRYAAVESDRPGVLEHEATVKVDQTYIMPAHWKRIATNLRAFLQPADSQAGAAWTEVDRENWTITPRGQAGSYWMLARADRADAGVANWQHEIEVVPEEDDEDI